MTLDSSRYRLWALKRQQLLHSKKPILVGPFRSEVGFEALYWLPFLEKLVHDGVARERLIPISRGGAAAWYGTPTGLELYAMRTPQQIRVENRLQHKRTGMLKQLSVTPFDQAILDDAALTLGLTDYHVLHPAWMYHTLAPFWEAQRGLIWLNQFTQWGVLNMPPLPETVTLPEHFVAMRFYLRPTFQGSDQIAGLITATIKRIASQYPVVVLHNDDHLDDHTDVVLGKLPNVTMLRDLVTPSLETNLMVQSAILARADAFVGTYGGFAQLALRFGRPVMSFYDTWGSTSIAHKHLSDALAGQMHIPFQVHSLMDISFAHAMLPVPGQKVLDVARHPQPVGVG